MVFGAGEFARLGEVARELGGTRCLLVADPGMLDTGYAQEATRSLKARRMGVQAFHEFKPNPDSSMAEAGAAFAAPQNIDLIVALGGGSSLDCAKAINLVLSNGGRLRDYRGYGRAARPMLPMIAVPTTAGTGSEALTTVALIDSQSGSRMICGDAKLAFRSAVLDPKLTTTQPSAVAAANGFDALAHAVESLVTTRRTAISDCFARAAWGLLHCGLERALKDSTDLEACGSVLLGAHFAGVAVENSGLGAAHACAYPLTDQCGIAHGVAVALVLARVVEWNRAEAQSRYEELYPGGPVERLRALADLAGLPANLREAGVAEEALPRLAEDAGSQWTGKFNSRPFDAAGALEIYRMAY